MGIMADSTTGAGYVEVEPGALCYARKQKVLKKKNDGGSHKDSRSQLEAVPVGQI